jgi:hypothetical protein
MRLLPADEKKQMSEKQASKNRTTYTPRLDGAGLVEGFIDGMKQAERDMAPLDVANNATPDSQPPEDGKAPDCVGATEPTTQASTTIDGATAPQGEKDTDQQPTDTPTHSTADNATSGADNTTRPDTEDGKASNNAQPEDGRAKRQRNLIDGSKRTHEENKANGSKGGKASGAARRERKHIKLIAEAVLSASLPDNDEARSKLEILGIDKEDITMQAGVVLGLAEEAQRGNAKAANLLIAIIGELPDPTLNVNINTNAEAIKQFESLADEYRQESE